MPDSIASLFCDLLYSALQREENEIASLAMGAKPAEHFLSSVAHAPELAVAYLVRKEALRRRLPIESEVHQIDLCLVRDRVHLASMEIKILPTWRPAAKFKKDVLKVLNQNLHGVAETERYNGWVLILDQSGDAEEFFRRTIAGIAGVRDHCISSAISVNAAARAHDLRFDRLQVVVFNPTMCR